MARERLLTRERAIYWPGEFSEIVDLLLGKDREGRSLATAPYHYNVEAIVLAAALGVRANRTRDVGSQARKEISSDTFYQQRLEPYLLLIPILGRPETATEALRPENEEALIREFERYAAGGLEIIAAAIEKAAGQEIEVVLQQLLAPVSEGGKVVLQPPKLF